MKHSSYLVAFLAVVVLLPIVSAQVGCGSITTCKECQADTGDCLWCDNIGTGPVCSNATWVAKYAECKTGWCSGAACDDVCTEPCTKGILPCSDSIVGLLFLMLIYGAILGIGAKLIADGSELLLEIVDPGLIGGLLLPVLGAVPDAAIVVVSGALGTVKEAQDQLAVGVGTLAGSTIMLLTIPWSVGLLLARTDIRGGESQDNVLTSNSLTRTGTTVDDDTPSNAKIMMGTSIAYLIGQGVAFAYLADPTGEQARDSEHGFAIAGMVVCIIFFIGYLIYQVVNPKLQEKKIAEARKRYLMTQVINRFMTRTGVQMQTGIQAPLLEPTTTPDVDIRGAGLKWKKKAGAAADEKKDEKEKDDDDERPSNPREIATKAIGLLILGTAIVSIFSDPMVDVISEFGNAINVPLFYVSFVVTPFCSNASELVSSLIFAAKKKKANSSLTYSALYGAATMNNTMVLGIFYALIAFRGLTWTFSAEVLSILLVTMVVGPIGLQKTMKLFWGIFVICLYPISIAFVALLEIAFHHVH